MAYVLLASAGGVYAATPLYLPETGHWYETIHAPTPILWQDAKVAAETLGGYLVTIESAAENGVVYTSSADPMYWDMAFQYGPWIGAQRTGGGVDDWQWVTGEPWSYTNWHPGQPDNAGSNEPYAHLYGKQHGGMGPEWNDLNPVIPLYGYVVEYNENPNPFGDFDADGDVDADDIDLLCDNIGDAAYDLDGDSDADEDDLIYMVENFVEWSRPGGASGVGTRRGDFYLDGLVNAIDLAIMKQYFGTPGIGWSRGNANCDDIINATDLAILKAYYGFEAPTGAVPEPATMGLLALGGLALLRRKK